VRYHYNLSDRESVYGQVYECSHIVYDRCTLYSVGDGRGLAVIQQRYNPYGKFTYWTEVDKGVVDDIYLNPGFLDYFDKKAGRADKNGLYPTVTVRQIMWALRMKPLPKEKWETVFDRRSI